MHQETVRAKKKLEVYGLLSENVFIEVIFVYHSFIDIIDSWGGRRLVGTVP